MFRTTEREKNRVCFQLGTADPDLALEAALLVKNDVAAIDINCGCPKHFSVHAGMGAALLRTPDLLCRILENLVQNLDIPVTCKIRIFDDIDETIELVKRIESTGVKAIAVHCRTPKERPKDRGHWEAFKPIAEAVDIPLIANGDIYSWKDFDALRKSGVSSVMLARAALANPSVFRRAGTRPIREVMAKYMNYCLKYAAPYQNSKFTLTYMLPEFKDNQRGHKMLSSKSNKEIIDILQLEIADKENHRPEEVSDKYDDLFPYIPEPVVLYPNKLSEVQECDKC